MAHSNPQMRESIQTFVGLWQPLTKDELRKHTTLYNTWIIQ